ncbi:hypothetical protein K445DRAFT_236871 [Daldinia sp. EC12]|nr:hypothetical protein K445DRAFT_236871 [Daldinia sp. EC12]
MTPLVAFIFDSVGDALAFYQVLETNLVFPSFVDVTRAGERSQASRPQGCELRLERAQEAWRREKELYQATIAAQKKELNSYKQEVSTLRKQLVTHPNPLALEGILGRRKKALKPVEDSKLTMGMEQRGYQAVLPRPRGRRLGASFLSPFDAARRWMLPGCMTSLTG